MKKIITKMFMILGTDKMRETTYNLSPSIRPTTLSGLSIRKTLTMLSLFGRGVKERIEKNTVMKSRRFQEFLM